MNEEIYTKLNVVISFFYKDIFEEIYLGEINKAIDESGALPIFDVKELLDEVALTWSLSYYLLPIIEYYKKSNQTDDITKVISELTKIDSSAILEQNDKALESLSNGPFGVFKYYWLIFNRLYDNHIQAPKILSTTIFMVIAKQLFEYGSKSLDVLIQE